MTPRDSEGRQNPFGTAMRTRAVLVAARDGEWVDPPFLVLRKVLDGPGDPGADLARLAAHEPDKGLAEFAMALLAVGLREPEVPTEVREMLRVGTGPVLREILTDPSVLEQRKLLLASVFAMGGGDVSWPEFAGLFSDIPAMSRAIAGVLGDKISHEPESVETALIAAELIGGDGSFVEGIDSERIDWAVATGATVIEQNPDAAAAILCAVGAVACEHRVPTESLPMAFDAVSRCPTDRVAWFLDELGRWPAAGATGELAAELARELVAKGVTPRNVLLRDFSHGLVSMVDGAGSRSVSLFFRTLEGGMDALMLLLNDEVGMKDAWAVFQDSSEVEKRLGDREENIMYAPCSLALARELVADTWAVHERIGRPLPGGFFIYRSYLGTAPIRPARRRPNLGAYMTETMVVSPALVDGSDDLLDSNLYAGLWFASDAAYCFVREHGPKRGRRIPKKLLEAFLREIVPGDIETLAARMAANLEVEALGGRAIHKANRIASRTWLGITQQCRPAFEIPYVRALAERSLDVVVRNVRMGFTSQSEVNQAGLERDDQMYQDMDMDDGDKLGGWAAFRG